MSEAFVRNTTPTSHHHKAQKMTLDEFMKAAGGKTINDIFPNRKFFSMPLSLL
jgi:hypothetical protein